MTKDVTPPLQAAAYAESRMREMLRLANRGHENGQHNASVGEYGLSFECHKTALETEKIAALWSIAAALHWRNAT